MLRYRLPIFALVLLTSSALWAEVPTVSELQGDRWVEVDAGAATRPVTDSTLDRAQRLLESRQSREARDVLLDWLKQTGTHSPIRDRALLLTAKSFYGYGDRIKAFYYCDELMDTYPDSGYFYPALELQFQIADRYLNGYKRRLLMIPMFSAEDEAIEMLFRIQQRSPGSPLAERALRRTADYYYNTGGDFDLAADAYDAYIKAYPRSPDIGEVKLRRALSSLAQFRGTRFDASPLLDARAELNDVLTNYPELAQEQNVQSLIAGIDSALAKKIYDTADFYSRTNEPKAAAYNYRYLIDTYPQSAEAERAKAKIARMPESVRGGPTPPPADAASGQ